MSISINDKQWLFEENNEQSILQLIIMTKQKVEIL